MESPFLSILASVAFIMLIAVTAGIGYLTLAGWRDRRRQEQEKRELRQTTPRRR